MALSRPLSQISFLKHKVSTPLEGMVPAFFWNKFVTELTGEHRVKELRRFYDSMMTEGRGVDAVYVNLAINVRKKEQ